MKTLSHILINCRTIPYLNTWPEDPSRLSAAIAYLKTCGSSAPPTSSAPTYTTLTFHCLLHSSLMSIQKDKREHAISCTGNLIKNLINFLLFEKHCNDMYSISRMK